MFWFQAKRSARNTDQIRCTLLDQKPFHAFFFAALSASPARIFASASCARENSTVALSIANVAAFLNGRDSWKTKPTHPNTTPVKKERENGRGGGSEKCRKEGVGNFLWSLGWMGNGVRRDGLHQVGRRDTGPMGVTYLSTGISSRCIRTSGRIPRSTHTRTRPWKAPTRRIA
jgi:hypothetical protein